MTRPVPGNITSKWDEMRPLSVPEEKRTHVHGAIDIGALQGTRILAPEAGEVFHIMRFRDGDKNRSDMVWPDSKAWFPWSHYYFDIYGCIIVLKAPSRVHLFAHENVEDMIDIILMEKSSVRGNYKKGILTFGNIHSPFMAYEGSTIGFVGNSGQSTGAHLHWEIHKNSNAWTDYKDREDPAKLLGV